MERDLAELSDARNTDASSTCWQRSDAAHGRSSNGWNYWLADTPTGLRTLSALRDELISSVDEEQAQR